MNKKILLGIIAGVIAVIAVTAVILAITIRPKQAGEETEQEEITEAAWIQQAGEISSDLPYKFTWEPSGYTGVSAKICDKLENKWIPEEKESTNFSIEYMEEDEEGTYLFIDPLEAGTDSLRFISDAYIYTMDIKVAEDGTIDFTKVVCTENETSIEEDEAYLEAEELLGSFKLPSAGTVVRCKVSDDESIHFAEFTVEAGETTYSYMIFKNTLEEVLQMYTERMGAEFTEEDGMCFILDTEDYLRVSEAEGQIIVFSGDASDREAIDAAAGSLK